MDTKTFLIIDNDPQTLEVIRNTFVDADVKYQICSGTTEGWNRVRTNPAISNVLIRMNADGIDGCDLCRRIRDVKSQDQLPILMIVGEDQLEHAATALEAGATDVLIDPFESRELRMRTNIRCSTRRRRVDGAHPDGVPEKQENPAPVECEESAGPSIPPSSLVLPKFDPKSLRFACGASESQIAEWRDDKTVRKVALDEVLTCPCCGAVPTFRHGCGACGSAWIRPDALIHHYACAWIGSESEFRQGNDLVCPKCRRTSLVAGSDFETVMGGQVCADCGAGSSQPELIGHCLSCQHRFPAKEATILTLTGFHVPRMHEVTIDAGPGQRRQRHKRKEKTSAT